MKGLLQFLKTTLVGGLVFLLPLVAIVWILSMALDFAGEVAKPMAAFIPVDTFGGIAMANLLAVIVILAVCFIAGIVARSSMASTFVREAESRVLWQFPGYNMVKGVTDSVLGGGTDMEMMPVVVNFDDHAQLGLEIERLDDGRVVVYLPGAPDPWSGDVAIFAADRVEALPVKALKALDTVRLLGRSSRHFVGVPPNDAKAGPSERT